MKHGHGSYKLLAGLEQLGSRISRDLESEMLRSLEIIAQPARGTAKTIEGHSQDRGIEEDDTRRTGPNYSFSHHVGGVKG